MACLLWTRGYSDANPERIVGPRWVLVKNIFLLLFVVLENMTAEGSVWIYASDVLMVFLEDAWDIRLEYHQVHKPFKISINLLIYVYHDGLFFPTAVLSTDASRAWTVVSIRRSWFSSHRSRYMNKFLQQPAIVLAFSFVWQLRLVPFVHSFP
jgi:hypothetical protein